MKKNSTLRDASYDWGASRYCGPTSLSALTGMGTADITLKLRRQRMSGKPVKGMDNSEMEYFLERAGYTVERVFGRPRKPGWGRVTVESITLSKWLEWRADRRSMYLIHIGHHYVCYQWGRGMVCTSRGGVLHDASTNRYLRSRVKNAWRVS